MRCLAGNHEEMFLRSFRSLETFRHFLRHGGRETLLSYGIDRTAFGLNWNAPLPKGGFALGNDVKLVVHLELVRQEAAARYPAAAEPAARVIDFYLRESFGGQDLEDEEREQVDAEDQRLQRGLVGLRTGREQHRLVLVAEDGDAAFFLVVLTIWCALHLGLWSYAFQMGPAANCFGIPCHDWLSTKVISRDLWISEKTVKGHLTNLFQRIGVADRTQAALWAERTGALRD